MRRITKVFSMALFGCLLATACAPGIGTRASAPAANQTIAYNASREAVQAALVQIMAQ